MKARIPQVHPKISEPKDIYISYVADKRPVYKLVDRHEFVLLGIFCYIFS